MFFKVSLFIYKNTFNKVPQREIQKFKTNVFFLQINIIGTIGSFTNKTPITSDNVCSHYSNIPGLEYFDNPHNNDRTDPVPPVCCSDQISS